MQTERFFAEVAAFAVPVRLTNMGNVRNQRAALFVHTTHTAKTGAAQRAAVIGVFAGNQNIAVRLALNGPVVTGQTHQGVDGFGARACKENAVQITRCYRGNGFCQFCRRAVGGLEKGVVVRQLIHLLVRNVCQFLAAIAQIDTPQTRHAVDDLVALFVPQVHAVGFGDNTGAFVVKAAGIGERMQMVFGIQLLQW